LHDSSLASITFAPGLGGGASLCSSAGPAPVASSVTEWSFPTDTLIAGNPSLELTLTSTRRRGVVSVALFAVSPSFSCPSVASRGARWLAGGGADLEHFRSRYGARPFPVGEATRVRIDLSDVTARIPRGYRLALVLGNVDGGVLPEPDALIDLVRVGASSRLVLPTIP
jgi:hypothetical protein